LSMGPRAGDTFFKKSPVYSTDTISLVDWLTAATIRFGMPMLKPKILIHATSNTF